MNTIFGYARALGVLVLFAALLNINPVAAQQEAPGAPLNFEMSFRFDEETGPGPETVIHFSWEANPAGGTAEGYRLYAVQHTPDDLRQVELADVAATSYELTLGELSEALADDLHTPLRFQVRAYNQFGESAFSNYAGDDDPGHGNDDGDEIMQRIEEIIREVAGDDFNGDLCALSAEQRAEINAKLAEEFGDKCPFRIICPGDDGNDWPDFPGDLTEIINRLEELIRATAGDDYDGDPCSSLSEAQRAAINEQLRAEFGEDCPVLLLCPGDEEWPDFPDFPDDSTDHDEIMERIDEIIREVAGEDFNGDPCSLSAEQRAEINAKLAEEFGSECPIRIFCPGDDGNDWPDWPDFPDDSTDYDEIFRKIDDIIRAVAGEDFNGDPCSLSEAQIAEINARIAEEFGDDCPFQIFCPGDDDFPGGGWNQEDLDRFNDLFNRIVRDVLGDDFEGEPTEEQIREILERLRDLLGEEFGWGDCPWEDMNNEQIPRDPTDKLVSNVGGNLRGALVVSVYPNPATSLLSVAFDAPESRTATLMLLDLNGNRVLTHTLQTQSGSNTVSLDIRTLNSGTYYVSIRIDGTNLHTAPVVIQR